MNNPSMLRQWQEQLRRSLPGVHLYQVQALAAFSFALACARHCHLWRMAAHVPSSAQPHSARRRLMRFLGNERLDVQALCHHLGAWLARWNSPSARLLVLMDETPLRNQWRVLKVSVAYKRRALPLVWCCYPLTGREHTLPDTVLVLLERAFDIVHDYAPQAQVVLLGDRGFCWPQIIRWCQGKGWHFVLRAQGHTRCRVERQLSSCPLRALASERGQFWCGAAQVFQKAGWLECNVVACWPPGAKDAWLLVTSLRPTLHVCRWYARRQWQEQSFRDEKSHGFCWQESHVRAPQRLERLLLLLALAQLWLVRLGEEAQTPQWRQRLGLQSRANRRLWSRFRTGWHLLLYALNNYIPLPTNLAFDPP